MNAEDVELYTTDFARAKAAYDADDFREARRLMKGVLVRAERIWGRNSVEIVEALKWLALATSAKNYGPAKAAEMALHKRMLRILRRAYGDDDLRTASALDRCALDLWGHGNRAQALRAYRRVLAVKERHIGDDEDYRMWSILDAMGALLIEVRRPKEAIPFLQRNVRVSDKGDHDVSKMLAHRLLARALIDAGRPAEAIESLEVALNAARRAGRRMIPAARELRAWLAEARAAQAQTRFTKRSRRPARTKRTSKR